jgi:GNAT superfamily N-acetyltransferase
MRLKESAGWNQTASDWLRMLRLAPEGCFGIEMEGTLAATATAFCYSEQLAWIGMVLTLPDFRGRGLARRVMEHALEFCICRKVRRVKLDATDMGTPLYEKLGFRAECMVERRLRAAASVPLRSAEWNGEVALELDRRAFGVDRAALLRDLAQSGAASSGRCAYAMGRPGSQAAYFGPCVSESVVAARHMLEWFLAAHPTEPVLWDVLPDNAAASALADEYGFKTVRRLTRMSLTLGGGAAPPDADTGLTFAIAGFEYG